MFSFTMCLYKPTHAYTHGYAKLANNTEQMNLNSSGRERRTLGGCLPPSPRRSWLVYPSPIWRPTGCAASWRDVGRPRWSREMVGVGPSAMSSRPLCSPGPGGGARAPPRGPT
ncbi:hypothetical protein JTE90_026553 [Oedothorax gibbosus]|uniref:Uncharacterized protein n=1 Tax=Oedothorax gibbosus TaxID=931172 RepID=A0AAV6U2W6_9ARAC|nr:hypothetical protein JTE90_026553 [Oedothorax gibbosus]